MLNNRGHFVQVTILHVLLKSELIDVVIKPGNVRLNILVGLKRNNVSQPNVGNYESRSELLRLTRRPSGDVGYKLQVLFHSTKRCGL